MQACAGKSITKIQPNWGSLDLRAHECDTG